jgi:tetratricopeptide (TPR) repeat protein
MNGPNWFSPISGGEPEGGKSPASSQPGREDFQVGDLLRSATTTKRYTVLGVKTGGYGAVYIVRDEGDGRPYALKTFQAQYLWRDEDRERFEREAITWVMLDSHPNIVTAHWVERMEGFPCLVLEYVPGGDLLQLLERETLSMERALELALQFCDGMAYAHRKLRIVHRDVKPENCLLAEDGTLKVTDFGLARAFGQAHEGSLDLRGLAVEARSQYTTPLGTIPYMAPEQFRAGAELDTRTDIYAFGIMLHQMLTGSRPKDGRVARAHIKGKVVTHQVPKGVLQLILRCVEPDPRKRPADFGEVRAELESLYRSMTGRAATTPAEPSPMAAKHWKNKGLALRALGRHELALICYDRGLELNQRDIGLLGNKGVTLADMGRYEEALACYERALAIAPDSGRLLNNKGLALKGLGRCQEALACYDRGLKFDAEDGDLWRNKGAALAELGRFGEALACFDQGLKVDGRNSGLWQGKGVVLHRLGRHEEALVCFVEGLKIEPRSSVLWSNKGGVLGALGRYEEALACFERGLEIDPDNAHLLENKGWVLGALGFHEEALVCFERCLEISPHDSGLWLKKGVALQRLDRDEEALGCFERGLDIEPGDKNLWRSKGEAFRALGRTEEAEACFRRAQEPSDG